MILSYSWLKEMVDLPVTADELAEVLTFLGLEVEEIKRYRPALDKVVIGEVLEAARIEGTDHLSITKTAIAQRRRRVHRLRGAQRARGLESARDAAGLSHRRRDDD